MISLNDILKLECLDDVKIRFNLQVGDNWNPIEEFKNGNMKSLIDGHYWNYSKKKSYKLNQRTFGFVILNKDENTWLLFHAGKVVKDLDVYDGVGYEYEDIEPYLKFCGRLIIRFKNSRGAQTMIRNAISVINECEVVQILPGIFDDDIFPGYENVNVSWKELSSVVKKESWKTALQNQKGVYLITDTKTGKMYVGSAYGQNMILGRWINYVKTCHGGNAKLKCLDPEYIKKNFRYSILDIFKSTIADEVIIKRESWWKEVLMTREFGYNDN